MFVPEELAQNISVVVMQSRKKVVGCSFLATLYIARFSNSFILLKYE